MGINETLAKIPSIVANVYDLVICIDSKNNKLYTINYNGDKISVSAPKVLDELNTLISSKKAVECINNNDSLKKIVDNNFIVIIKDNNYKLVFISNIVEEKTSTDKKGLILIADDSPIITKFFTKTFKDEYNILVASDGNEAISMIEENKESLMAAFLDLQMPNKNGYEVLEYMKDNNLFKNIPVSIISGEDSKDGIAKATSVPGVVDMLLKPFSAESARTIVNKTISFNPSHKEF